MQDLVDVPIDDVRVFVGAPIADRTEQRFLGRLVRYLVSKRQSAVILANFELGTAKRQIDFLVATATQAIAVEIKGYRHPVTGTENGQWSMLNSGMSRDIGFPYAQARDNRFSLCDELRKLLPPGNDPRKAISGMLCMYPSIPAGSSVPQNSHKLKIGGFEDFISLLQTASALPQPLSQWEALAVSLNLATFSAGSFERENAVIGEYLSYCSDLSEVGAGPYIQSQMVTDDGQMPLPPMVPLLAQSAHIQIIGPSGVGKTRLVANLISDSARAELIPLHVAARDFDGTLLPLLRKSVAQSTTLSFESLMKAASTTGHKVVVFVDALNECSQTKISKLLASLQAIALRYGATILLTDQKEIQVPSILAGEIFLLSQPDTNRAKALVEAHLTRPLAAHETVMLEIVASAQDATVLAAVLGRHRDVDSRLELYHTYTVDSLPETPQRHSLHEALGMLARHLRESYLTTISAVVASQLLGKATGNNMAGGQALADAEAARLVQRDDESVRFRHDLIADYFATDHLLRMFGQDELPREIARPINVELQEFILGGCSSSREADRFLKLNLPDSVFDAVLYGRCGVAPKRIMLERCGQIIEKIRKGYCAVRVTLHENGDDPPIRVTLETPNRFSLTEEELRAAHSLATALYTELYAPIMSMLERVDGHLWEESRRLRLENPDLKRNIPGMVFGGVYGDMLQAKELSLLRDMLTAIVNVRAFGKGPPPVIDINSELDRFEEKSPGQLLALLSMHRAHFSPDYGLPKRANELVKYVWQLGIYHMQLLLMDLIHFNGRRASEDQREELHATLTAYLSDNPWMNMILMDAITAVGEIDFGLTVESIASDYEEIAVLEISEEAANRALSSYTCTYDHPASDMFCEAFYNRISAEAKSAVLTRAIASTSADSMSLDFAIRELGRNPSIEAVPLLKKLTVAPVVDTPSAQSSVSVFAEAVGQLARMGVSLPAISEQANETQLLAWHSVRPLIFALNCTTRSSQTRINTLWWGFRAAGESACVDVLYRLMKDSRVLGGDVNLDFIGICREGVRSLSLEAIKPNYIASTIFSRGQNSTELTKLHRQFAFSCLGIVGGTLDRTTIEAWIEDKTFGSDAIRAIRQIEAH